MGICSSRRATATVPSVPHPQPQPEEEAQSTRPTSIPLSTATPSVPLPTKRGVVSRVRARMQSEHTASSRRLRDAKDYPLPSSGDDVFTSQHSDRLEKHEDQYPSSEMGSIPRKRSLSMGSMPRKRSLSSMGAYLQGARSHSPGHRTRFTSLHGSGQEWRPRFPSSLPSLLPNGFRFKILVVGKRGAGKSSLINAIFNVNMSGAPINVSGRITEFRPRDNRHLMVHECSAFGPGEMQALRDSITLRNHKSHPASERLHAIWICIPMPDVVSGQLDEALKMLLGTGVPLVIVFTKVDLVSSSHDYESHCRSLFGNVPTEIVSTQPRFRDRINKLVVKTDGVVIAHSRNISASSESQRPQPRLCPVSLSWSVSQRASRDINIQASIEVGRSRYWRRLWSSDDFVGQTLGNCVGVIHADIVGTWNLPDKDKYLSSMAFRDEMSYLVQDLTGSPISTSSRPRLGSKPCTGAPWLNGRYENSKENMCLVVSYIVDLTIILCGVFGSRIDVSPSQIQSVINNFASATHKASIHAEILSFVNGVPRFEFLDNDVVMTKIRGLISRNCL